MHGDDVNGGGGRERRLPEAAAAAAAECQPMHGWQRIASRIAACTLPLAQIAAGSRPPARSPTRLSRLPGGRVAAASGDQRAEASQGTRRATGRQEHSPPRCSRRSRPACRRGRAPEPPASCVLHIGQSRRWWWFILISCASTGVVRSQSIMQAVRLGLHHSCGDMRASRQTSGALLGGAKRGQRQQQRRCRLSAG